MRLISSLFLVLGLVACQSEASENTAAQEEASTEQAPRVISLNGTLTELLYALDLPVNLVGVDVTSTYPAEANRLPKLGHIRQLNPEAILALSPDVVFYNENDEGAKGLQQLRDAGIALHAIAIPEKLDAAAQVAKSLCTALDQSAEEALQKLKAQQAAKQAELQAFLAEHPEQPKVLFLYARGSRTLMIGGQNTFADAMIRYAGGQNAAQNVDGFKSLNPEALLEAQPEYILLFEKGLKSLSEAEAKAGIEAVLALPGVAATPAGEAKNIISMDGQLLSGFGPRATQAALELAQKIHRPKS